MRVFLGVVGLALLGLVGCGAPIDSFHSVTPRGEAIVSLFWLALILSAAIVLLVIGTLAYVVIRFRDRGGADEPEPPQVHGNTRLEIAWTIAPALLLTGIFFLMLQTMRTVEAEVPSGAIPIRVIGRQWWWELQYTDLGIVTANELHVPVGQPVKLQIEAADVIHSFWVPQLGWKKDGIPGSKVNDIWAEFREPGVYEGACTEYCGSQHAWMRVRVVVDRREQFDAWVRQQQQPAASVQQPAASLQQPATLAPTQPAPAAGQQPAPAQTTAARGQQVFLQNTCVNCHAVAGTVAAAQVGPDLTHFGSRATIGAGVVANTPEDLARWVREAQSVKPGVLMPNYSAMPDDDVGALVDYLSSLK